MSVKKESKPTTEFWQKLITVFFDFCREKFERSPSFDGAAPRDLKMIVEYIKKITVEDDEVEWTENVATERLHQFLTAAHMDKWLRDNFLLLNLNRQKDKIIFLKNKFITDGTRDSKNEQLREDVNTEFNRRYSK